MKLMCCLFFFVNLLLNFIAILKLTATHQFRKRIKLLTVMNINNLIHTLTPEVVSIISMLWRYYILAIHNVEKFSKIDWL